MGYIHVVNQCNDIRQIDFACDITIRVGRRSTADRFAYQVHIADQSGDIGEVYPSFGITVYVSGYAGTAVLAGVTDFVAIGVRLGWIIVAGAVIGWGNRAGKSSRSTTLSIAR